jgi:hypothetical protein
MPGFDPAKYDRAELIGAVSMSVADGQLFTQLAKFPQVALDDDVPHGANGFPDRPRFASRTAIEGIPLIFSLISRLEDKHFARFNLDRRGKHGETILAHAPPSVSLLGKIDVNATDRHGNTTVMCNVLARWRCYRRELLEKTAGLPQIANENGDSAFMIINARARRTATEIDGRRAAQVRSQWRKMERPELQNLVTRLLSNRRT